MLVEAVTPGVGIVGAGGLVAFIAGAFYLFDPAEADIDIRIALPLLFSAAAMTGLILMGIGAFALKARKRAVVSGAEQLIGGIGQVVSWQGDSGTVRIQGEVWSAHCEEELRARQTVQVVSRQDLVLEVKRNDAGRGK